MVFNLVFGVILVIFDFFIDYLNNIARLDKNTYIVLIWLFRCFPVYALSRGILKLYMFGSQAHMCDHLIKLGIDKNLQFRLF